MSNSGPNHEVTKIISKIMDEQLKSFDTNSSNFKTLLEENKMEEIVTTSILPIHEVLKSLRNENSINSEELNERIDSLMKILQLLQEFTDENQ